MQSMAIEQRQANWSISGIYDLGILYYAALIQLTSRCPCLCAAEGHESYSVLCTQHLAHFLAHDLSSIFIK